MSQSVPIYKKFFGTAGLMMISKGLMVLIGVVVARSLGPESYGMYGFVLSIITLATIPVFAGLPQLLIREIANSDLQKKWSELKGLLRWSSLYVFAISLLMMLLLAIAILLEFVEPVAGGILWIALLLVPLKGTLAKQSAVLNGFRKPILAQLPSVLLAPTLTLFCLAAMFLSSIELTVKNLIMVQLLVSTLAVVLSYLLVHRSASTDLKLAKPKYLRAHWHSTLLPFTLAMVIGLMGAEIASAMLGFMVEKEAVGYFKVAMQGVGLIALGLGAINTVTGPNIARLYKAGDIATTQRLLTKSVRLSCLISLPICLILIFQGDWFITLLFGVEYLRAATVLSILCIGQIANVLMGSVGLVLNMTGNEKKTLRGVFISLILTIVLLFILIPEYKEIGAAIAVSISMIFWNVLLAFEAYRLTNLKTWLSIKTHTES